MPNWRWIIMRVTRQIWFRAAVISLLSVLLVLASEAIATLIPYELSLKIGGDAVEAILKILASSMLVVAIFSLTAMVTAFSTAAQHVTPRATQLLVQDKTAQNAFSTFLGAFLFAIVGMIALSAGIYSRDGRAVLLIATDVLIIYIVVVLIRWIQLLTTFGRVDDAIERIERVGRTALGQVCGQLTVGRADKSSDSGIPVTSLETGYITYVDRDSLTPGADRGGEASQIVIAGDRVDKGTILAMLAPCPGADCTEDVRGAFRIMPARAYDHDPRYAMVVLSEIASRALSPAINDQGTAIAALDAGQRLAEAFIEEAAHAANVDSTGIAQVPFADFLEGLILPIARDGAATAEVGARIQRVLGALARQAPQARDTCQRLARDALERANKQIESKIDRERVELAHRRQFG